ncbi:MAG: hypothetical protein KC636_17685, partial [Myxococcales bacterium]|nr:hypothetical protein [Myxococcales bacterium]
AGHRFAARVLDEGVVTMLTTQFPSTTAAHVTTLHTGRPVWESGVFEWYYFEPLLDAIFSPLLHARLDDAGLVDVPATAGLFPESTLYEELAAR